MQTFLPYSSFRRTAQVLDRQRLNKQGTEAMQILDILLGETDKPGWRTHPAVLMWQGYEEALALYGFTIMCEWIERGYNDHVDRMGYFFHRTTIEIPPMPPWLGDPAFHRAHRSNLLRKLPEHYRQFWPRLRDDLEYVWPTAE